MPRSLVKIIQRVSAHGSINIVWLLLGRAYGHFFSYLFLTLIVRYTNFRKICLIFEQKASPNLLLVREKIQIVRVEVTYLTQNRQIVTYFQTVLTS